METCRQGAGNYRDKHMNESEIRTLIDSRSEAIRMKDINRLMPHYSPDIVYFDAVPPLRYVGSAVLRDRFLQWFDGYSSGIEQDVRDLNIMVGEDIAVAFMLIRTGGTLKNGNEFESWVRATSCCKRSDLAWLITHEHISVPVDPSSGSSAIGLVP
jgi:ketosteroid isomerase-like protein